MRYILPLLLATPLAAHEYQAGGITIDHPFAYVTDGPSAEGYVILVNQGAADSLVAVTSDRFDATLIAETPLAIPANGVAELLPGGAHIRFDGLSAAWAEGDQVPATLIFEKAGAVPVVFYVEARP